MSEAREAQVVAALIWDGCRFLACQRPAHKARGLLWEFVGGKVEPGETEQEALIRECREELSITIGVNEKFMGLTHEYEDLTVHLSLYNAVILAGTPQKLEHNALRWITTDQMDALDFCPADAAILERLKAVQNGLQARLLSYQDGQYRDLHCRLMPTVPKETVIGIRIPQLRAFSKEYGKTEDAAHFLAELPHRFYEENNLHGMLISQIKDPEQAIVALDAFLPFVDNWATCDLIRPAAFHKRPSILLPKIRGWMGSAHCYTVRFGIEMLMTHYLDGAFDPEQLEWVAGIRSQEYYVNMMIAWYFATALAKQYSAAVPYLEGKKLPGWVHRKTVQKAVESRRISPAQKAYLRSLKGGD